MGHSECRDCGNAVRPTSLNLTCHASCCKGNVSGKLCSTCSRRHEAQGFLDTYGYRDKAFAMHHDVIVTLMLRFRDR